MTQIHVALIADKNYVIPTKITIRSICQNRNKYCNVYVHVIGNGLENSEVQELKKTGNTDVKIEVINIEKNRFDDIAQKDFYVSASALIKFDLPNLLKELNKVLYLDSDLVVEDDLLPLWNIDLGDNYAAATIDFPSELSEGRSHILGTNMYFNSGVMLLNLKKLREDKVVEELIETKRNDIYRKYMDQDAFNITFSNKTISLPLKYNFLVNEVFLYSKEQLCDIYNNLEDDDFEHPTIVHFAGISKPWKDIYTNYVEKWFKYVSPNEILYCIQQYRNSIDSKINDVDRRNSERIDGLVQWNCTMQEQINSLKEENERYNNSYFSKFYCKIKDLFR